MAQGGSSSIRPIQDLHPQLSSLRMDYNDEDSFVVLQEDVDGNVDYPSRLDSLPILNTTQTEEIKKMIEDQLRSLEINSKSQEVQVQPSLENSQIKSDLSGDSMHPNAWCEDIQNQVEILVKENKLLKETLAQNNLKLSSQKDKLLKWQEDVERINKAHRDKLVEAKILIDKLEDDKIKMTADVEKLTEIRKLQDDELMEMKLQQKALSASATSAVFLNAESDTNLRKIEELNDKITSVQKLLDLTRLDNVRLQAENEKLVNNSVDSNDLTDQLSNAREQIEHLQLKLNVSNKERVEERENAQKENDTLKSQINSLRRQVIELIAQINPNLPEKCSKLEEQLTKAQIKITELKEELGGKHATLQKLTDEFDAKKIDLEEIDVLRQQLDVYKQDFEDERTAKDTFRRERDQLVDDLQNLQRRNSQLQNELEVIHSNKNFVVLPPQHVSSTSSTSKNSSMGCTEVFTCPKCQFAFNNYQALDNHVHRCLDLMDSLP